MGRSTGNKDFCLRVSPQVTPLWYSFWKRTPQTGRDLQVLVPAGSLHSQLHPCPCGKTTSTTHPQKDDNPIIKLCTMRQNEEPTHLTIAFVLGQMIHARNYPKRILKIKGAKGTVRSHNCQYPWGTGCKNPVGAKASYIKSLLYKSVWYLQVTYTILL